MDTAPVVDVDTGGEVEVIATVPAQDGYVMEVTIPLMLVPLSTCVGVVVGIIVVGDSDKPETVAEMVTPTVEHSFWANIRAPITLINEPDKSSTNTPHELAWSEVSHCVSI